MNIEGQVPATIDASLLALPDAVAQKYRLENANISRGRHSPLPSVRAHYEDHLSYSRDIILKTADTSLQHAPPGMARRALILGAGNCYDIPLAELADAFDHTVVVDIDARRTAQAIASLTLDQLARVSLIGADVTGLIGKLTANLDDIKDRSRDYSQFVAAAASLFTNTDPDNAAKPQLGDNYTFVCSQLLLTQLSVMPLRYMREDIISKHFDEDFSFAIGGRDEDLVRAANEFTLKTQVDHISYLSNLVSRTGNVHLTDTYSFIHATQAGVKEQPMVIGSLLDVTIDAFFNRISPSETWVWQTGFSKGFQVVAHTLAPSV